MKHNRRVTISVGSSRKATNWQPQILMLDELYEKLRIPAQSTESMAAYLGMTKGQQDDLKDVGGFVAGTLQGPRRKAGAVTGREILTLDLDNIPAGGTDDVLRRIEGLECGYCVYSTRKHMPSAPRLRVLLPLDRTCTADEYEPCARRMAEYIGIELADPTTFEASRLMYWPSTCADSQYVYHASDKPMLSVDGLLKTYANWKDQTSWPTVPGAVSPAKLAAKQGDPEAKTGVVGGFCRVYDIEAAMAAFLPGIYEPVSGERGRYTYTGGSTTGGAVLYDNGKFLYSHHATDPCGGKLVNAFDLVRIHRFGDMDDEAAPGTPTVKMPSFTAMRELAANDTKVSAQLADEHWKKVQEAFHPVQGAEKEDDGSWRKKLSYKSNGVPENTMQNLKNTLLLSPELKGRIRLNLFPGELTSWVRFRGSGRGVLSTGRTRTRFNSAYIWKSFFPARYPKMMCRIRFPPAGVSWPITLSETTLTVSAGTA